MFTVNVNNMAGIYMFIELFIKKLKWKCGSTDSWLVLLQSIYAYGSQNQQKIIVMEMTFNAIQKHL